MSSTMKSVPVWDRKLTRATLAVHVPFVEAVPVVHELPFDEKYGVQVAFAPVPATALIAM
jgi:hypothetical protein